MAPGYWRAPDNRTGKVCVASDCCVPLSPQKNTRPYCRALMLYPLPHYLVHLKLAKVAESRNTSATLYRRRNLSHSHRLTHGHWDLHEPSLSLSDPLPSSKLLIQHLIVCCFGTYCAQPLPYTRAASDLLHGEHVIVDHYYWATGAPWRPPYTVSTSGGLFIRLLSCDDVLSKSARTHNQQLQLTLVWNKSASLYLAARCNVNPAYVFHSPPTSISTLIKTSTRRLFTPLTQQSLALLIPLRMAHCIFVITRIERRRRYWGERWCIFGIHIHSTLLRKS